MKRARAIAAVSAGATGGALLIGSIIYAAAHYLGVPVTVLLTERANALSGKINPMPGLGLPDLAPRYWVAVARTRRRGRSPHLEGSD